MPNAQALRYWVRAEVTLPEYKDYGKLDTMECALAASTSIGHHPLAQWWELWLPDILVMAKNSDRKGKEVQEKRSKGPPPPPPPPPRLLSKEELDAGWLRGRQEEKHCCLPMAYFMEPLRRFQHETGALGHMCHVLPGKVFRLPLGIQSAIYDFVRTWNSGELNAVRAHRCLVDRGENFASTGVHDGNSWVTRACQEDISGRHRMNPTTGLVQDWPINEYSRRVRTHEDPNDAGPDGKIREQWLAVMMEVQDISMVRGACLQSTLASGQPVVWRKYSGSQVVVYSPGSLVVLSEQNIVLVSADNRDAYNRRKHYKRFIANVPHKRWNEDFRSDMCYPYDRWEEFGGTPVM